jgi:hypothetical protein
MGDKTKGNNSPIQKGFLNINRVKQVYNNSNYKWLINLIVIIVGGVIVFLITTFIAS